MTEHVAILAGQYEAEKMEELLYATRNPIAPWQAVQAGDTVYVKRPGGPIWAVAQVRGAPHYFRYSHADEVQAECRKRGWKPSEFDLYLEGKRGPGYATFVGLHNFAELPKPIQPLARSYGSPWIVLDTLPKRWEWLPGVA